MKTKTKKQDMIIHDIRSKLFVVMLHVDLLKKSIASDSRNASMQKSADAIRRASESMKLLLDELSPLS